MKKLFATFAVTVGAGLSLAGCETAALTDADLRDGPAAADVIRQVKSEIGQFNLDFADPVTKEGLCTKNLAIKVQSADIQLATTATNAGDATGGVAQVPLLGGTLKANGTLATTNVGSATTTFTIQPLADKLTPADVQLKGSPVWDGKPVYSALKSIRQSIIDPGNQKPCATFKAGSTIKLGFTLTKKASGSAGFNILVFAIGGDASREVQHQNIITVTFNAEGEGFVAARTPA